MALKRRRIVAGKERNALRKSLIDFDMFDPLPQVLKKLPPKEAISKLEVFLRDPNKIVAMRAQSAIDHLVKSTPSALKHPSGTVLVAAEHIAGSKKTLRNLVSKGLIVPAKYVKRRRLKIIRDGELANATHFMVPVRDPRALGIMKDTHGRAVFVEHGSHKSTGTHFFKGVGMGWMEDRSFWYGEKRREKEKRFWGGYEISTAMHDIYVANRLYGTYLRLKKKISANPELDSLLKKHDATFFPGMRDLVLFKPEQLPVESADAKGKLLKGDKRGAGAARVAGKVGLVKTRAKAKSYGLPTKIAGGHAIVAYRVKTPHRIEDIKKGLKPEVFLPLYGMSVKEGSIYFKGKKITPLEATEKLMKSFAARQALSYLTVREANVVPRSKKHEKHAGYTIFSWHNTTAAGENLDYDTATVDPADRRWAEKMWKADKDQILKNIELFTRDAGMAICGPDVLSARDAAMSLGMDLYSGEKSALQKISSEAQAVFERIINRYYTSSSLPRAA